MGHHLVTHRLTITVVVDYLNHEYTKQRCVMLNETSLVCFPQEHVNV